MATDQKVDYHLVLSFAIFVVIILGLYSRFTAQKGTGPMSTLPQGKSSQQKEPEQRLKKLNFQKPIGCNLTTPTSSLSAQLESSSFSGVIQMKDVTKRAILEGDCLYSWNIGEAIGRRQCKIGNYVGIARQLLSSGFVSGDILSGFTKQMGKSLPVDMDKFLESCSNINEVKKGEFVIPKNIQFLEEPAK